MRKLFLTFLSIFMAFCMTACGNSAEKKAQASKQETAVQTIKQELSLKIYVKDKVLKAMLVDNSSTRALIEKLKQGPVTIDAHDYGNFEKVGDLGFNLPQNDEHIVTVPGDLILYQGRRFVIYYDTNTWDFTRLGKIKDADQKTLKDILGDGKVTVRIEL